MNSKIMTLSIGRPKNFIWKGKQESSGIGKKVVEEAVLSKDGFKNDGVSNLQFHGGPERAVCLYPFEHYAYWERQFEKKLQPPAFGENICVKEMLEKDVYIGDIFSIGDAVIQVTQGRIPCSTISKYNNIDNLLVKLFDTGYTGYFLKVLKEGKVFQNSKIELIERTQEDVTVLFANQTMFQNKKEIQSIKRILKVESLAADWQEKFTKALNNMENSL